MLGQHPHKYSGAVLLLEADLNWKFSLFGGYL